MSDELQIIPGPGKVSEFLRNAVRISQESLSEFLKNAVRNGQESVSVLGKNMH